MKNIGLILIALLALAAGGLTRYLFKSPQQAVLVLPAFSLPDTASVIRDSAEWQGTVRLINFWATWCPPCKKELPLLMALHNTYAANGLVVLGIALDDSVSVMNFLASTPISYPLLLGEQSGITLARQLGNRVDVIPFTVIVDKQNHIIYQHQGELTKNDVVSVLQPLLEK
jgi:thiol-disulfide isomerase/thioredoxin